MSRNLFAASAAEVFTAATVGGAESLGRSDLGRLAPGAKADVLLIDLRGAFRKVPLRDPIKFVVECGVGDDVDTAIVNGTVRMAKGAIRGLDAAALMARTQRLAEAAWAALPDWDPLGRTAEEMGPYSFPLADR